MTSSVQNFSFTGAPAIQTVAQGAASFRERAVKYVKEHPYKVLFGAALCCLSAYSLYAGAASLLAAKALVPMQPYSPNTPLNTFPEDRCSLEEIQAKVNKLNIWEPLSVQPPIPEVSPIVQQDRADLWVNAHCKRDDREVAQFIKENIRHVTHREFEEGLEKSVMGLNDYLESLPPSERDYISYVEKYRSYHWVHSLALRYLQYLPKKIFSLWMLNERILTNLTLQHPSIKNFVIFDDCLYSGKQMANLLSENFKKLGNLAKDPKFRFSVVIPFLTDPAKFIPENLRSIVNVFYSEVFPNLGKIMPNHLLQKLEAAQLGKFYEPQDAYNLVSFADRSLIYFDHKKADAVSILTHALKHGIVPWTNGTDESLTYGKSCFDQLARLEAEGMGKNITIAKETFFSIPFLDPVYEPYRPKPYIPDVAVPAGSLLPSVTYSVGGAIAAWKFARTAATGLELTGRGLQKASSNFCALRNALFVTGETLEHSGKTIHNVMDTVTHGAKKALSWGVRIAAERVFSSLQFE